MSEKKSYDDRRSADRRYDGKHYRVQLTYKHPIEGYDFKPIIRDDVVRLCTALEFYTEGFGGWGEKCIRLYRDLNGHEYVENFHLSDYSIKILKPNPEEIEALKKKGAQSNNDTDESTNCSRDDLSIKTSIE
ncbi:hypothetical protein AALA22_15330 [Anaerovoracaceae bacterium 41-7]